MINICDLFDKEWVYKIEKDNDKRILAIVGLNYKFLYFKNEQERDSMFEKLRDFCRKSYGVTWNDVKLIANSKELNDELGLEEA